MRLDVSERPLLPALPQILHPRSSSARRSVVPFPNPPALDKTIAGILDEPFKISNSQATRQINAQISKSVVGQSMLAMRA
jgi:hypothetical protein